MYSDCNYVITGDYNLNQFDWSIDPITQHHNTGSLIFHCYLNYLSLKQVNTVLNCSGRTLDCIMISADAVLTNILHSLESLVPIIDYYHPSLDFIIQFNNALVSEHFNSPVVYNFKNCNFDDISHFLRSIDFDLNLNNNLSFESLIETFYEIIYHYFSLFVPKTKIYNKYSLIWANAELRDCIIKKKCAHKKIKLFPSDANYFDFSNLRKKYKHLITISHDQYISNIENSIQTNIKPFWNYVNSLKKFNNSVPDCVNYNNSSSTNISETAQLFANYFSSVYTKDHPLFNGVVPLPSDVSNNYLNLCSWTIELNEIVDYLNSLNTDAGLAQDLMVFHLCFKNLVALFLLVRFI